MGKPACWVLWGLLVGGIVAGVAGAEEALTPEQVQEDIRLLQAINKLNLTPGQGWDLLACLEKIGQSQALIQAQEENAYASLREALAALKEALIQGGPPPVQALRKIDIALAELQKVYDRENPRLEKEIRRVVQEVLTEEQRQRLEPDPAKQERLARERQERKRREQVCLETLTVIDKWVRNQESVSDATYQQQRQQKATSLAIEAVGQQDSAQLEQVANKLVILFDHCRKLDDRQYIAQREAIQKQLQIILQPQIESPEEAYYIMSESEFWEFLRKPRVAQLLRERLPYLPGE